MTNIGDVSVLYDNLLAGTGIDYSDLNSDGNINVGDLSVLYKMILEQ